MVPKNKTQLQYKELCLWHYIPKTEKQCNEGQPPAVSIETTGGWRKESQRMRWE